MEFYYFGGNTQGNLIERLEKSNFSGVMFTYDSTQGDIFTHVARYLDVTDKIKFLIAIRPYAISPQYICMINQSIRSMQEDRLQINFISGYVKDHEKNFGGIVGDINDSSNRIDRSNYMIEYINVLNKMPINNNNSTKLDFYISTTNKYIFETAKKYNNKMILSYRDYKNSYWTIINEQGGQNSGESFEINGENIMIALTPIIRKTKEDLNMADGYVDRPIWREGEKVSTVTDIEYFTYEEFDAFVKTLESNGVNQILINGWPEIERDIIIDFIKEYTELVATRT